MKAIVSVGVSIALISAFLISVHAAPPEYPGKNEVITLTVPAPAGGVADLGARILADAAEKKLGCRIVVSNKPGAGQQVGFTEMSKQKPNGYYIGYNIVPALNTTILDPERKAVYNLESFTFIINQMVDPGLIFVKADSPYRTLKDLIDDARNRPGKVTSAGTGILNDDHLAMLMVEKAAAVQFRIVQTEGSAAQVAATLGGHVDVSFDNVGILTPRIKAGLLRGLAVLDNKRSKYLPDVPTASELGYPDVISAASRGVLGPKGMPEFIVRKLQVSLKEAMEDPEYIKKMQNSGMDITIMVGDEYIKYIRELHERAKPLVEAAVKAR
jgi:tripartite-type tricarboxylate transporter receptor subunit TctC